MRDSPAPPPPPPPPLLADVMAGDGISWSRLVIAAVLLALSLAIGYRTARDPPPPKAVPQPVSERVVAGVELPPLDPPLLDGPQPFVTACPAASPARLKATEHAGPPRAAERRQVGRAADRSPARQASGPRPHHVAHARSELRTARRSLRTRAHVRAEYLRSRDVVAALTGEDSGSAYLMRAAARRAAREGSGHRRR